MKITIYFLTKHLDSRHTYVYIWRMREDQARDSHATDWEPGRDLFTRAIFLRARSLYTRRIKSRHISAYTRGTNLHESALLRISPRFITLLERSLITVGRRRRGGALKTARGARWVRDEPRVGGRRTPLLYKERVLRITTSSHFEKENAGNNRAKCVEWRGESSEWERRDARGEREGRLRASSNF